MADGQEFDATVRFKADISELKASFQDANKQIKALNAEFYAANGGYKEWEKSADGVKAKLTQLNGTLEAQKQKLESVKKQYELVSKAKGEDSKEAQTLKNKLNYLEGDIKQTEKSIADATSKLDTFGNEEKQAGDSTKALQKDVKGASDGFTVMKGVMVNLVTAGINVAVSSFQKLASTVKESYAEFKEGSDNLIKATGATGKAAEGLTKSYANVAKSVVAPMGDIGSTIGEVNTRFGYTGKQLEDTTKDFEKFSKITGVDATQSVQLVSRAMGDAGIKSKDYKSLLDELAVAGQASGVSVDKLTENLTKYGAPMRQLGFDTKSSIALFAQWEKEGVNTEIAFSGMKKAISNWTAAGKDGKKEFAKFVEGVQKGTIPASKALEVFGAKAGPDLVDAIKGGRFEYSDFLKIVEKSAGTVDKTYKQNLDAVSYFKLAMQNVNVSLGQGMTKLAKNPAFMHFAKRLVTFVQTTVPQLVDSVMGKINAIMTAFNQPEGGQNIFNTIQNAAQIILPLITQIKDTMMQFYADVIQPMIPVISAFIAQGLQVLQTAFQTVQSHMGQIQPAVQTLQNAIVTLVQTLAPILQQIIANLTPIFEFITKTVLSTIITSLVTLANVCTDVAKAITALLNGDTKTAIQYFKQIFIDAFNGVIEVAKNLGPIIANLVKAILLEIGKLEIKFIQALPGILVTIEKWKVNLVKAGISAGAKFVSAIINALKGLGAKFLGILKQVFSYVASWASSLAKRGASAGRNFLSSVINAIKSLPGKLWGVLKNTISKAGAFVASLAKKGTQAASQFASKFVNGIKGMPDKMKNVGSQIIAGIWNGINDKIGWLESKVAGLKDAVVNSAKKAFEIHSPSTVMEEQVGIWLPQGVGKGVDKGASYIVNSIKRMAATTINASIKQVPSMLDALRGISDFSYSDTGSAITSAFGDALKADIEYTNKNLQYKQDQELQRLENELSNMQSKQETKLSELETQYNNRKNALQTKVERQTSIIESYQKRYEANEKTLNARRQALNQEEAKSSKKRNKSKIASYKADIKMLQTEQARFQTLMASAQKELDSANSSLSIAEYNYNKQVSSVKGSYDKAIANLETYKDKYSASMSEFLAEFQDAMNEYQAKAQNLVDTTIKGITDEYQKAYDDLESKQNSLVSKMQGMGDLFTVSNSGVLTINDIEEQTRAITEYADRLQNIKGRVSENLFNQIASYDVDEGSAYIDQLLSMSDSDLKAYSEAYERKLAVSQESATNVYKDSFERVASGFKTSITDAFKTLPQQLEELGVQTLQGFTNGLERNTDYMESAVRDIISKLENQFKVGLGIHSPSTVAGGYGEYTTEGFAGGMIRAIGKVKDATNAIIKSVSQPLQKMNASVGLGAITQGQNSLANQNTTNVYNIELVQNNTSPRPLSALDTYKERKKQVSLAKTALMAI